MTHEFVTDYLFFEPQPKKHPNDDSFPLFDWQSVYGCRCRVELLGDSKLVVNWINGVWSVRNPKHITKIMKGCEMLQQFNVAGVEPRLQYCHWNRHVLKHHNRKADGLATLGKDMASENVKVVFNDCTIGREINYVR